MNYLILGGGITGLSAAWFLLRKEPQAKITLLEKEQRLGGWIRTSREGGFLFEKGPRTFPLGRCPHLLRLIQDLGLPILTSPPQKRYLWLDGRLRSIGSLFPLLIPSLIKELFISPSPQPDESIYDFAARRFSPKIAETLFDPLTLGIYAGDIRSLSIRACFPTLHRWEQEKGSVVKGLLAAPRQKKGLFTLPAGMGALVEALRERLPIEIVYQCNVESIGEKRVIAGGKVWEADRVISALPPPFPSRSIWVVNLAYEGDILKRKGYGYLIPSKEKELMLGAIFDSSIFPEQNKSDETRLTAMVRAEASAPLEIAKEALRRHLGIRGEPVHSAVYLAEQAIPQFEVGSTPEYGISVEACIERAAHIIL